MFKAVDRASATCVLIDSLADSVSIEGSITIGEVLLKKTCTCPSINQIVFAVKSEKAPDHTSVKKLLLVLLAARTTGHNVEKNETHREVDTHG